MSEENSTTIVTEAETPRARERRRNEAAEQIVDSAMDLGRLWARHGLTLGKLALETSAVSLGTTARLLGGIADAFAPEARPEPGEKA